jgi:hypothetical protein
MTTTIDTYEPYRHKYLRIIYEKDSKLPIHKLYEYAWAIEEEMIMWDDIPRNFKQKHNLPHMIDYGIDLIKLDESATA